MKRILAYGLIIMLALSCADIQEPEVHNDDSALDGWWYLAALSDTENMTSGDPQLFDEQYTADDTREWRHISGTRFTKYELLFMVGYDIDPETGDFIEIHKKYVAEYPKMTLFLFHQDAAFPTTQTKMASGWTPTPPLRQREMKYTSPAPAAPTPTTGWTRTPPLTTIRTEQSTATTCPGTAVCHA